MGRHDMRRRVDQLVIVDPDERRLWRRAVGAVLASLLPPGFETRGAVAVPTMGQGLRDWQHVEMASRTIINSWPALGDMAEPADIVPTLHRAHFQLARLLVARDQLDKSIEELRACARGLPDDDPLQAELSEQRRVLDDRHQQIAEQVTDRTVALQRLATRCGEFAHQRQVAERARRSLKRAADTAAHLPAIASDDPVQELTERTEAVLDAYRELIAQTGQPAIEG